VGDKCEPPIRAADGWRLIKGLGDTDGVYLYDRGLPARLAGPQFAEIGCVVKRRISGLAKRGNERFVDLAQE
jgi:hypothetical protein